MSEFEVIDREIAPKGICYLICTAYERADFSCALAQLCDTAVSRGAKTLRFACRDLKNDLPSDAFLAGTHAFSFYSDFDLLQKPLAPNPPAVRTPLHLKPLRPATAALYLELYNETFFDVPNSTTMTDSDAETLLADAARDAGFLLLGGNPVGIYELSYKGDVPEIASLGVREALRNQGCGAAALALLEARLACEGHSAAELLVAGKNECAYRLYRAHGYAFVRRIGHWYEATERV